MTNYEKYRDCFVPTLEDVACRLAVTNDGRVCECKDTKCGDCIFVDSPSCYDVAEGWLKMVAKDEDNIR